MQTYEVIAGFSNIKVHLIQKCRLHKSPEDIMLWFSQRDNEVYAHDYADHKANILIALIVDQKLSHYLDAGSIGLRVVEFVNNDTDIAGNNLAEKLNNQYMASGYFFKTRN